MIPGRVFAIRYLNMKIDESRHSEFVGICTNNKRRNALIDILNRIRKEGVELGFSLFCPGLDFVRILKRFRKSCRLRNIKGSFAL